MSPDPSAGRSAIDAAALNRIGAAHTALVNEHGGEAMARISQSLAFATGAAEPVYPHPLQRPERSFLPGLTTQPWFDAPRGPALDEVVRQLEAATDDVRREALASSTLATSYLTASPGDEARREDKFAGMAADDWRVTIFRTLDGDHEDARRAHPATARLLDAVGAELLHRGDAMFSVLAPGAVIPPHHDGCNYKLTIHLALEVPPKCGIVVGGEARTWTPGRCEVFDDTFLHEAYNRSSRPRICLLVDVWHPDITPIERTALATLIDASVAAYDLRG